MGIRKKKVRICKRCGDSTMDQPYRDKYCPPCKEEARNEAVGRTKITTKKWAERNKEYRRQYEAKRRHENPEHFRKQEKKRRPRHPLYSLWTGIKTRCYNENSKNHQRYKNLSITMCNEWFSSFDNFIDDVPPKPPGNFSLDRIDNEKGYEPGNVRWATKKEQSNNRQLSKKYRENVSPDNIVIHDNKTHTLTEISKITGIPLVVVKDRYAIHRTWDLIIDGSWLIQRCYEYQGNLYSPYELHLISEVPHKTMMARLYNGWPIEKAVETPVRRWPTSIGV